MAKVAEERVTVPFFFPGVAIEHIRQPSATGSRSYLRSPSSVERHSIWAFLVAGHAHLKQASLAGPWTTSKKPHKEQKSHLSRWQQ